jgi:hypothetical protein
MAAPDYSWCSSPTISRSTAWAVIIHYARRILIENGPADAVNVLHLDAAERGGGPQRRLRCLADDDGHRLRIACWR